MMEVKKPDSHTDLAMTPRTRAETIMKEEATSLGDHLDPQSDLYKYFVDLRAEEVPMKKMEDLDTGINKANAKRALKFLLQINLETLYVSACLTAIIVYKV